jgi:hypothetical protein
LSIELIVSEHKDERDNAQNAYKDAGTGYDFGNIWGDFGAANGKRSNFSIGQIAECVKFT